MKIARMIFIGFAIFAVGILGGVFFSMKFTGDAKVEAAKTQAQFEKLDDSVDAIKARQEAQHEIVRTKIEYRTAEVRQKVIAMDDDAVADGLNELTRKWRLEKSTGRVRDDGVGISGDVAGRARPAGRLGGLAGGKRIVAGSVLRPEN